MKALYKSSFLIFIIYSLIVDNRATYPVICALLLIVACDLVRMKYLNHIAILVVEVILIGICTYLYPQFVYLFGAIAFDAAVMHLYLFIGIVFVASIFLAPTVDMPKVLLLLIINSYFGYISDQFKKKEESFKTSFDSERRYSYELEQAKAKLLNSTREVAHLAEIRERNRIAREIHDSIGHSIAGVLINLQAGFKLLDKNPNKASELLQKCITSLSDALTTIRNTVHNIKPEDKIGIEYLKNIIEHFEFCKVDFSYRGDIGSIASDQMELLATNIKEALTNASKHSGATKVEINLEMNSKFTRLYIKDNGSGCTKIKEGMGLSGMRERVQNFGGSLSISCDSGFLIVCVIPVAEMGMKL